jgi:ABC transporter substrate binding protein
MRRREFLSVLSSAVSWPIVVRAQTPKLRTIGFLGTDATNWAAWTAAFVARMRELGWIELSTIAIEYRWSEGRSERVVEVAAEFVRLKVDVIVSYGTAIPSLMQATSTIPIVFAIAIDPVGAGLVAEFGAAGRQCDRCLLSGNRCRWKAPRPLA